MPGQNVRKKWNRTHKDISEADIVLIIEPDLPLIAKSHSRNPCGRKWTWARCHSEKRTEIDDRSDN